MQPMAQLDPNFAAARADAAQLRFYPVGGAIPVYGFCGEGFRRVPERVAAQLGGKFRAVARGTSGGRIRIRTDSARIALRVRISYCGDLARMTLAGTSGFDLYVEEHGAMRFARVLAPSEDFSGEYVVEAALPKARGMRTLMIHFPLYSGVDALALGLENGAHWEPDAGYRGAPMVFYGSSITQGGCASRPGNSYPAILSRRLRRDFLNLGFAGNAFGEQALAQYIAALPMSVFIMDYDYNARSAEQLFETHAPFFETIRARNPALPILLLSRPNVELDPEESACRRAIVRATYESALRRGDRNVWFVDGAGLFGKTARDCCTVDAIHPNDLGFLRMAQRLEPVLREALSRTRS